MGVFGLSIFVVALFASFFCDAGVVVLSPLKAVGPVLLACAVLSWGQGVDARCRRRVCGVGRLRLGWAADGARASARGARGLLPPGKLLDVFVVVSALRYL